MNLPMFDSFKSSIVEREVRDDNVPPPLITLSSINSDDEKPAFYPLKIPVFTEERGPSLLYIDQSTTSCACNCNLF